MRLLRKRQFANHWPVVVVASVFIAPSLLMAEDRPGFYSSEFRSFERTEYITSLSALSVGGSYTGNGTVVRCSGSECTSGQFDRYGTQDLNNYSISFFSPHINNLSVGASFGRADGRYSNSQETLDGLHTAENANRGMGWNVHGSYLLSDDSQITSSISQYRNSTENQTRGDFSLGFSNRIADSLILSGYANVLWGDEQLPNGVKHVAGRLDYSESFGSIEANGFFNLYSATSISRSSVAGVAIASEAKYTGAASGGTIYVKRNNFRFGLSASLGGDDSDGSPRSFDIGPQYIFTGSKFEFRASGNYKVSQSENVATSSGVTNYSDNVTKELRFGYVRELTDNYYLDTSIMRSWNSNGSSVIGTEMQSQTNTKTWTFGIGLTKQF